MLNKDRLMRRDRRKPDVETCPCSESALYLQSAVMLPYDVARRRKPKTVTVMTRRKERLEDPLQCPFLPSPPRIGYLNLDQTVALVFLLRKLPAVTDLSGLDPA